MLFIAPSLRSQSISNYTFSASSTTFTALSGPTNPGLSGTADEGYFNAMPIGFDFWYMGVRYTTVSASTNGWLTLGANVTDAASSNNLSGGAPRPVLAPLWDDLDMQSATNVSYLTSGTAPNRIFTLQFLNAQWNRLASGNTMSFQAKLYEGSGKIEFVYKQESGSTNNTSGSIGISATATGSGNFMSVRNTGASVSTNTEYNITSKPVNNNKYIFTPPVPTAPASLIFSDISNTSMTLNWGDLSANERGFVIYKSTDGTNYTFVTQTAANVGSSVQSGLSAGTLYYWKIYAVSEGGLSTALSGSQSTVCTQPAPPTVTSPLDYCLNAAATPLSATGASLLWGGLEGSVGGTSALSTIVFVDNTTNNKKTKFSTSAANVKLASVDYYIPANQTVTGLVLSIYNSAGSVIATASTTTTLTANATAVRIRSIFNYTLGSAGDYSIGISGGSGNIGYDSPAFPLTEASGTIVLTGVTATGVNCFNNFQFVTSTSSTAPTPSTASLGAFNYLVSQTVSGCESPKAIVVVNVTAPDISQIPSAGLIGNYRFNGNAADVLNNNPGTLQNSPVAVADRFGNSNRAYSFNGSSQYISTANQYVNPPAFSLSIWFKTTTSSGGKLIGFGASQTGLSTQYDRHIYMNNAGQLYFGVYPGTVKTVNSALSYNDNAWHMATATFSSASGMILYVDGAAVAADPSVTIAETTTGYWRIAYDNVNGWTSQSASNFFNGILDDALIYNRALSAAEVGALFTAPDGAGNNGPVCTGSTITLSATNLSGATYSWSGPNGFTSSVQNPSFTYTSAGAGAYTLTVTANGCSTTAQTNVLASTDDGMWTGSVSTDWATADNWCSGVIPGSASNVTIPAGVSNMPTITGSASCKNLTINGSATLTTALTGVLNISGTLLNNGAMINNGTTNFNGSSGQQTFSGVSAFSNLTLSNSSGLLLPASITVAKNLTLSAGVLNANNFNISVGGNWVNNASVSGLSAGTGAVTFNGSTAQSIGGSFVTSFSNLNIANSAATVGLNINASVAGNLTVSAGTFDLGTYTANRVASGGILTVANNATMKIGGTNAFPANYSSVNLMVASTVEYNGTNQSVANQTYGNLTLSSSGGSAVKTFPGTAFSVIGNLSSTLGAGSAVAFTAASNIIIGGNVSIGASTTFNGGSFALSCGGNWLNNGVFTGNTSSVTLLGPGSQVSGSGVHNFHNLTISASQIGFSNAGISVSGNLSTVSSGSFTQASGGAFDMTGSGKTISGMGMVMDNLVISGSISTASSFQITGNLSGSGSFTASAGTITMSGASKTITGSGSKTFAVLSASGTISTNAGFSISSSLIVSGAFSASAGTATFTGASSLSGTANLYNVTVNGTSLQLSSNAVLGISNTLSITSGVLNCSSSTPNTVNFNGSGAQSINGITYDNLILTNGNTKTAAAGIIVNNSITIGAGTTFNPGAYTHSIYVDWNNYGTFTGGSGTIEFLGSQNTVINGVTAFNILTINNSATSTAVMLHDNISAATVNMIQGTILTNTNTLTITNTRTGNGLILGNIQRTHAFGAGVAYAFEGPDNTITFSAVSSVTSITVSVVKGSVADFPYNASIGREYDIQIPAGTYTATLRLHYEDIELNGNSESSLLLWNYNGTAWIPSGKSANSSTSNYIENSGLTNIATRWTCGYTPDVVQWNGSVSTDWNTAANWTSIFGSGSTPPSANDVVALGTAPFTYQPSIGNSVEVKNIVFGSAQAVTLTMAGGGSLVSGDVLGIWTGNATHTINANNQTVTVNGSLLLSDGTTGHAIDLNIGSGTLSVSGTLLESGGANISFGGAGTLNIFGDFNYLSGTFTPGSGVVEYYGTSNQDIGRVNYHTLIIDKASGIASIHDDVTITGDLYVEAGQLDNSALTTIGGSVHIDPGATLQNLNVFHIGGNWLNNGSYFASGAMIVFDGAGTQSISASTFNNFVIDKPVGSLAELTGNIVINGDFTVNSGTFDIHAFDCNRSSLGGVITLADSATFIVGGNNPPTNFAAGSLAVSSTVIANGSGAQVIFGQDFGNLVFRNAGAKTLISPISVHGNLVIENGSNFDAGANTLTLGGDWINEGTFIPGNSTIVCTGSDKIISGNSTFHRFSVYGSYTILDDMIFDSLLVINTGGSLSGGATIHTVINGDLINRGVLYTLGTSTFTGDVLQTLSLIDAVQTVAVTVNFNGSVSPILNSSSAPQFGYLNINNTGGIRPSVGWTVLYGLTVGPGATFDGGELSHNIMGYMTNNGTIISSGVINFLPSSAQTIDFGSDFSSTGLIFFGGSGAITLAGAPDTLHDVTISNTNAAGLSPSSDWGISNNLTVRGGSILNAGNYNFWIGNNLVNNGTINSGTSDFVFNGTTHQDIYNVSPFYDLTIDNAVVHVELFSNATVNGTLKFIHGNIETEDFTLSQPASGNVDGAAQNTGWVVGNFRKNISVGTTLKTFEVGDASIYAAVSLNFSSVSTAGDITVHTTAGDHPDIESSIINGAKSVNRFWTIQNAGVVFGQYSATLNFSAGDVDGGADTAAFGVEYFDGSTWVLPSVASPAATHIQATGLMQFGDFAVGEVCNIGTAIAYSGTPYCSDAGTATVTLTGSGGGTFSGSENLSLDSGTGDIDLGASAPGTYIVNYLIDAAGECPDYLTSATIEITEAPVATITYAGSPFCSSYKTGSVTRIGTAGGVYSSTSGLSINSTSGAINLSASTPGAYTVTYTIAASGGCSEFTTTADLIITQQPFASGTYEGNPYCSNGGTAFPTGYAEGLAGLLTSTAGLAIDPPTGVIDLAASTPGIYTVTYTVPDSLGCGEYSNTATVDITAAPVADIAYDDSPYCPNAGIATVDASGGAGGVYSSTPGLTIDAASGDINLGSSVAGTYTVTYTIAAANGCAEFSTTADAAVMARGAWTGAGNDDWSDETNWNCNALPLSSTNVVIAGGLSNYPVVSADADTIHNLTIEAGASLTLSDARLKIAGGISNNGLFDAVDGSVELLGWAAQSIPASAFYNHTIKDLVINNAAGVTLEGALDIVGNLDIAAGSLNTGDFLTLKSNASGTASVTRITSSSPEPIQGKVKVERFIPGRRKYRLIASSATTSSGNALQAGEEDFSIWGNWQNRGNNTDANQGTLITGGSAGDGFDTQTNNASLFTYDDVNRKYVGFTSDHGKNTKYTPLKAGVAYFMFVYGDRLNSVYATNPHNTVLTETGVLKTGDQTYNSVSEIPLTDVSGRYTLLGNPFACAIDWAGLPRTDLENTYWGWDPNLSSTGGYVTVSNLGDVTLISPYTGSTGLDRYIQAGQGFFVRTSGPSPELVIREEDKVSNFNGNAFRPSGGASELSLLAINLQYANNGETVLADGVVAAYDAGFTLQPGFEDAAKLETGAENIAIIHDSLALSIDARPLPQENDTLFLQVSRLTKPHYKLQIFGQALAGHGLQAYILDHYRQSKQMLSLSDTNFIDIDITEGIPASAASDRFRIVFHNDNTVPVSSLPGETPRVFPNPVHDHRINLDIPHAAKGEYAVELTNAQGQRCFSEDFIHNGGDLHRTMLLDNVLAAGAYQLHIRSGKTNHAVVKVILMRE